MPLLAKPSAGRQDRTAAASITRPQFPDEHQTPPRHLSPGSGAHRAPSGLMPPAARIVRLEVMNVVIALNLLIIGLFLDLTLR